MRWAAIILGLLLAITSVILLLSSVIQSGYAIAVGVLGIGLIAVSDKFKKG